MARRSKNYWKKKSEELIRAYQKFSEIRVTGTQRQRTYWRHRIEAIEEEARVQANRRYGKVMKQGLGNDMGWWDKIQSYIRTQASHHPDAYNAGQRLISPNTVDEAYETAQTALHFLSLSTSTETGVKKAILAIKNEVYNDFELAGVIKLSDQELKNKGIDPKSVDMRFQISDKDFLKFWKWRQMNPVHEFFKLYPPSPPELRGSVGTMVVDLWNSSEINKKMLTDYFAEYQRYLETQNEDWSEGIPTSTLIERLDKLYESIGKRRRF